MKSKTNINKKSINKQVVNKKEHKPKGKINIFKIFGFIIALVFILVTGMYVGTNIHIYSKVRKQEKDSIMIYTSYLPKMLLTNKVLNIAKINNISFNIKYFNDSVVIPSENIKNVLDVNLQINKTKFENIEEISNCNVLYIAQNNFTEFSTSDLKGLNRYEYLDVYTLHEENKIKPHALSTKVENGSITIKSSLESNLGYIVVYVDTKDIIVKDVIDEVIHIGNGNDKMLEVEVIPSNATNNGIKFSSYDENIAKVEENKLFGCNLGDTYLLVQNGKFSKNIGVHVANYVTSIVLNTDSVTLNPNNTFEISYSIVPEDAENKEIIFEVADESIVSIEGSVIKALNVGKTSVTAKTTSGNIITAALDVSVVKKVVAKKNTTTKATYINGILIANKTYALPSSYNPGGLTKDTMTAFNAMKAAAAKDGVNLWISSGFRSYTTQDRLYNNYVANYGKKSADTFSARPGHSEHQTGLAMDVNYIEDWFGDTKEGKWLAENCHKYGFIIRYPRGKESITGYKYEPWHIRYLGVDVATAVYNSGLCLEEYLNITSKYAGE